MVKPYLNQVGGEVENDVSLFTGGLNTYVDKAFLEADQMPYVMNMTMKRPPAIETRDMRATLANNFPDLKLHWEQGEIINMWAYSQEYIYFLIDDGSGPYYKLYLISGSVATKLAEIPNTAEMYHFCYCRTEEKEYVYIANEAQKFRVTLGSTNPLDFVTYSDGHYGIPCWHKSRLWLLKPTQGKVEWSNAMLPDDFTIGYNPVTDITGDSGEVPITNSRGKPTGLVSFDDKLIIFSEHSIAAMYGNSGEEILTSGETALQYNPEYFTLVELFGKIGCREQNQIALGDGAVYWLGDDMQIYEYTGASFRTISKPGKSRNETISVGGIHNVINLMNQSKIQLEATSDRLYVDTSEGYMFVFDTYNRVWWCEDGGFSAMANYSQTTNNLLMATHDGDILDYSGRTAYVGYDEVYDWENNAVTSKIIEFEFHTRVYGAEGTDLRKSIAEVWMQVYNPMVIDCDVYINDAWCASDKWNDHFENTVKSTNRYKKIGSITGSSGVQTTNLDRYDDFLYEQRRFIVEKMFGQRLNTFQVIVKGSGYAKFYTMKREWRAR